MGGLELLSALNWCMAILYAGVALFVGVVAEDLRPVLVFLAVLSPMIAGHAYLGATIDKGKGRALQTVFAVLGLLSFPIGTLFGLFALYLCWFSDSAQSFDPRLQRAPAQARRRRLLVDDPDVTPLVSNAVRRR